MGKYPPKLIADIAQEIGMGMVCFLNTDTFEYDCVMGDSYCDYDDELNQEIYDKVDKWEHVVRIEPLTSSEAFMAMERFIEECIPDEDSIKERLINAISNRKPFQNFKDIVERSEYSQSWFDFRQSQFELGVLSQL